VDVFLSELAWRDYAQNQIVTMPDYGARPANPTFESFPWRDAPDDLKAWQQGRTGYPIVDAGMRQLWLTGWMHNRVRMIVASLLIKHLGIDWRVGEQWFWDTLVDADYAQNAVNWQWSAGSGWMRTSSPASWLPSRSRPNSMPPPISANGCPNWAIWTREIHDPSPLVRRSTGYPAMIVGHVGGRERALAAYGVMKGRAAQI
jgi:deoxyribodipyrimidine photo-lyase